MNQELILILKSFISKKINCDDTRHEYYKVNGKPVFCPEVECANCIYYVIGDRYSNNLISFPLPEPGSNHESFSSK